MAKHDRTRDPTRSAERRVTGGKKGELRLGAPGFTPEADTDQTVDTHPERAGVQPAPVTQQREPAEGAPRRP